MTVQEKQDLAKEAIGYLVKLLPPDQALSELEHHISKLKRVIDTSKRGEISEYCADVANIAMKISEVHGCD